MVLLESLTEDFKEGREEVEMGEGEGEKEGGQEEEEVILPRT